MDERRRQDNRIDQIQTDMEGVQTSIGHLHDCIESVKADVRRNTVITEDVRDVLGSFRVMASIAKWVTAIAAAYVAVRAWFGK